MRPVELAVVRGIAQVLVEVVRLLYELLLPHLHHNLIPLYFLVLKLRPLQQRLHSAPIHIFTVINQLFRFLNYDAVVVQLHL